MCRGATKNNFEKQYAQFCKQLGCCNASARDRTDMFRFGCYWTLDIDDGSPLCGVSGLIERYSVALLDIYGELDDREESESEESVASNDKDPDHAVPQDRHS